MESFFSACSFFDGIELRELLLRRYHSLDFIDTLSISEFVEFVNLTRKKDREDKIYHQWCCRLPQFYDSKFLDFEYYKSLLTGENIDTRSVDEIIKDIEETHSKAGMEWTYSS